MAKEIREVKIKFTAVGDAQVTTSTSNLSNKLDKVDASTKRMTTSMQKAKVEASNLGKATQSMSNNAGLANASVQALGQGIGDARYGFGAIANNISQVGSLFGGLVTKAGGVMGALKSLGQAMIGPMGIMFAFQGVVAAIDYFTSRTDKAGKSASKMAKALGDSQGVITKLKTYADVLKTASPDTLEFKNAMKKLKDEGFNPAKQSLDDFIDSQIKYIQLRAKQGVVEAELSEQFAKLQEFEADKRDLTQKIQEDELRASKETNRVRRERIQNNINYNKKLLSELQDDFKPVMDEMTKLQNELSGLTSESLTVDNKGTKSTTTGSTNKESDLDKFKNSLNQAEIDAAAKTEEQKIEVKRNAHLKELEMLKINDEERKELTSQINEYYDTLQNEQFYKEMAQIEELEDNKIQKQYNEAERLRSKYEFQNMTELEQIDAEMNLKLLKIEGLQGFEDLKTQIEQEAADKRVAVAEAEAEAKKDVLIASAGAVFGALSSIGAKNQKAQQKFAIAQTLMNTYQGMSEIEKKFASPELTTDRLMKIAAQAQVLSNGFASIRGIKNAGNGGSGGGSVSGGVPRVTTQAPSFNVIGQQSAGESGIRQDLQSLANGSLKAHVVESELTTAQNTAQGVNNQSSM